MIKRCTNRTAILMFLALQIIGMGAWGEDTIRLQPGNDPRTSEAVLFPFDPYSVPFRHGLELTLVKAGKQGIVLKPGPDGSPDSARIDYYGSVLHYDGKFHMWYRGSADAAPNFFYVCYAVSDDGMTWERPKLGLVDFNGNRDNNIVQGAIENPVGIIVLEDPEDPDPARRLKMFCEARPLGYGYVAYSADGLHWTQPANNPVYRQLTEPSGLVRRDGMYYVTMQGGNGSFKRRVLISIASADFEHWSESQALGFRRDNIPPRPYITGNSVGRQVHIGAALWDRGNVVLGLYGQWNGPTEFDDRRDMRMNLGLVVTNDALHYFEPIPDFPIVDPREEDWGFEDPIGAPSRLSQGQGFVNHGDGTFIWYGIWGFRNQAIRAATWTRDRLGYFQPNPKPIEGQTWFDEDRPDRHDPHFVSAPIEIAGAGARVFVNAEFLSEHAQLTVELLDKGFNRIKGFSGEDCIPVREAGLRQAVTWRGGDTLPALDGPIRVRVNYDGVRLEDSCVYAVYVEAGGESR